MFCSQLWRDGGGLGAKGNLMVGLGLRARGKEIDISPGKLTG